MSIESTMYQLYIDKVKNDLKSDLGFKSIMQVPKVEKVVVNMGLGKASQDKQILKDGLAELEKITGLKPVTRKAKASQAAFKIRQGMPIGATVTLRGQYMWSFLDKLNELVLPRIRDFRGLSKSSFDSRGNISIGIKEFIVFPEIDLDKVKTMKGMDITIVTSSKNDEYAFQLLNKLGFPFKGHLKSDINTQKNKDNKEGDVK